MAANGRTGRIQPPEVAGFTEIKQEPAELLRESSP